MKTQCEHEDELNTLRQNGNSRMSITHLKTQLEKQNDINL